MRYTTLAKLGLIISDFKNDLDFNWIKYRTCSIATNLLNLLKRFKLNIKH